MAEGPKAGLNPCLYLHLPIPPLSCGFVFFLVSGECGTLAEGLAGVLSQLPASDLGQALSHCRNI